MTAPVLQVVICSTRPGRVGPGVARWFQERAAAHGHFEVELVDLKEVDLPMFDEPNHPRLGQYVHQHTLDWSATISRGDAYVFVVPEYNFGFNAATKNALDYLSNEWQDKPIGFASYGGIAAGTRAVQMLKQVVTALKLVPVAESVNIAFIKQQLDEDGRLRATDAMGKAAASMLDELARLSGALKELRRPGVPAGP